MVNKVPLKSCARFKNEFESRIKEERKRVREKTVCVCEAGREIVQ